MPAPNLTIEQAARVAKGLCGCGCGRHLKPDHVTASTACRSRAYRQRRKSGNVLNAAARTRLKQIEAIERREQAALSDQTRAIATLRWAALALAETGRERAALLAGSSPVAVLHGLALAVDHCLVPCSDCDGEGTPLERESARARRERRKAGRQAPICRACDGTGVQSSEGLDAARREIWAPAARWSTWGAHPVAIALGGHAKDRIETCPDCRRLVRVHDGAITAHTMGGRKHAEDRCTASGATIPKRDQS